MLYIFYLTVELVFQQVQIGDALAKEESHLFTAGLLAVNEQAQRPVLVNLVSPRQLVDLLGDIMEHRPGFTETLGHRPFSDHPSE